MFKFVFNWFCNFFKTVFSRKIIETICVALLTILIVIVMVGVIVFGIGLIVGKFNEEVFLTCCCITAIIGIVGGIPCGLFAAVEYYFPFDEDE